MYGIFLEKYLRVIRSKYLLFYGKVKIVFQFKKSSETMNILHIKTHKKVSLLS